MEDNERKVKEVRRKVEENEEDELEREKVERVKKLKMDSKAMGEMEF